MLDLSDLERALGVNFKDKGVLRTALVHRSHLHENPHLEEVSNERLEFLGDALLSFVVAHALYTRHPELTEGGMTRIRSEMVRFESLERLARDLNLGEYLILGRGEEQGGGRTREKNLARVIEALMGAILEDQGYEVARDWVMKMLQPLLEGISNEVPVDYKSELQEKAQARGGPSPEYKTVQESGPAHAKAFVVDVIVGGQVLGRGTGKSKHAAEKEAAKQALRAFTE